MRNIPVFSTDLGVGSLVLEHIPYTAKAYVHIHDSAQPREFIDECADFCRAAGADMVLATGHDALDSYPLEYEVCVMTAPLESVPDTDAAVIPVTEATLDTWVRVYNEKMAGVDGAAFMSSLDAKKLLSAGCGYFVHKDGILLGIGKASAEEVEAIATAVPGMGKTVFCALCHCLTGLMVRLQVASTNTKAIRLYEKLGLVCTGKKPWYRIR